jgi:putative ABC transport system substrate-binding protein
VQAVMKSQANAAASGLMAYGVNMSDLVGRGAVFVDEILKGARSRDLPVEQPTKFALVINLKIAKVLGLTIPKSVLQRADEVIQ